ncbi:piggyBac transposable element-derived protein 4-like [Harpegnathos saltator]|uniref:piggyBac transposable element-derived protein 4-like n=1 Tax=Harpegnathos saltator TaxID=610380 RepID=UPI000DBED365|nr:piggyBac transposable element-derived protein 4-like [Harpegnathos saltator]
MAKLKKNKKHKKVRQRVKQRTKQERKPIQLLWLKIKSVWNKVPTVQHQTAVRNILRQRAGAHRSTETLSICNTFKKIMSNEMIYIIVRYTNKKVLAMYEEYNNKYPEKEPRVWKNVTLNEMYAFLGILICAGANNSNTDHVEEMWKSSSYPLYRATVGINRFKSIIRFIRFDDFNTRQQRLSEDKAAPIRDLWNMLNANLYAVYKPTENLTIDEQLFPFRGRTKFTQYIPSEPANYAIKVWWICDAENSYPLKGLIYTGKTGNTREVNQGERVVKELAVLYKGSGINSCMDNFFTSLPLAKHLLSWNLTIVSTLKKNKSYT